MICLYSTHCPKCKIIEMKLAQKHIEYTMIDDVDEVVKVGKEHEILSAPILAIDSDYLDFSNAIKYINAQ